MRFIGWHIISTSAVYHRLKKDDITDDLRDIRKCLKLM